MPIRLGDIQFGVVTGDEALDRTMIKMARFGQVVERAARATGKGARQTESDFRRQERAILGSLQAILKFQREAKSLGTKGSAGAAGAKATRESSNAFRQLTLEMTKGKASALTFDRAMARFNATLGASGRRLRQFKTDQRNAALETQFFGVSIRDFASASVIALGPLSGLGAQIQAVASIAARTSFVIAGLIATVTLAGVALAKLGSASITTAKEMDIINARMTAIAGTTAGASKEFDKLKDLAEATGLSLADLSEGFTRLQTASQGTGLEGAKVTQIFEDISFAAAKFRLPAEDVKGVLKAIEQIMSKGTVTAEELRQQLGDRLPGAFNRAADAMGLTTVELNKMLKQGKLLAVDFLPLFAKEVRRAFGAESVNRIESLQASIGRLDNAMFLFNLSFDRAVGVSKVYRAALDTLSGVVGTLAANMDILIGAIGAATFGFIGLAGPGILRGLGVMLGLLKKVGGFLLGVAGAATGLGLALKLALRFIVGAGVGFAVFASGTSNAIEAQNRLIDRVDAFVAAQENAKRTALDLTRSQLRDLNVAGEQTRREIKTVEKALSTLETRKAGAVALGADIGQFDASITNRIAQLEALKEVGEALAERESILFKDQKRQAEVQRKIDAAAVAARQVLFDSVTKSIDKINQEAAAMREGAVAVALLKAEFKDLETLGKIEADLIKAFPKKEDLDQVKEGVTQAKAALLAFNEAARGEAFKLGLEVVSDMNALVVATRQGEAAVIRFNRELADTRAAEKFGDATAVQTRSLAIGAFAARVFARALSELRAEQDKSVLAGLDKQIDVINQQAEALEKGKGAVEALNAELARTKAIEAFTIKLLTSTENVEVIKTRLDEFKASLVGLADVKTGKVIEDIATATANLSRESEGVLRGTKIFEEFKQVVADNKFIDKWRQKLIAASDDAAEAERILRPLIEAMRRLRDVTQQVAIDDALRSIVQQVSNLRLENEALAKGPKAFEAFSDVNKVTEALATEEKRLKTLGIEGAEATFQLDKLRQELERNAALLRENKGKKKQDPLGALADVEQTIKRIRLEIEALAAGPAALDMLAQQFDIADELASTIDKLDKEGVSAQVAAAKVLELRDALIELANVDREIQRLDVLDKVGQDLDRLAAQLAAMQTGSPQVVEDLLKAFERSDLIADFRKELDPIIFTQGEINRLTERYTQLIDGLKDIAPAFRRQVEAMQAVKHAMEEIEQGLSDVFAQMVLDAEFSMQSLVDLGRSVVQQLLSEFFRLAIIKPLLDDIMNPSTSTSSGGGGGGLFGSLLKIGTSILGGVLGGGAGPTFSPIPVPRPAAHGTVLGGPTLFGGGDGSLVIGGEAGGEGLLPLIRNSRGDLSVNTVGGGGSPNITFNIHTPNPPGFFRAKSEMAAMASQFVNAGSRNA